MEIKLMSFDLSEESLDSMLDMLKRRSDSDGKILINCSRTYIIGDGEIDIIKRLAKDENLLDYLDKMLGSESTIIVSPKTSLMLGKLKKDRERELI